MAGTRTILGILGSGQLGRMMCLAAQRLGYVVHVFSPEPGSPTGQVADLEFIGKYDDPNAVAEFAEKVDVLTFEFENISAEAARRALAVTTVRPSPQILETTQHRIREKTFLKENGFPVTDFVAIDERATAASVTHLGLPLVVKTAAFGYDGKGQKILRTPEELSNFFKAPRTAEWIAEKWVPYRCEVSGLGARTEKGEIAIWNVAENHHENHVLDYSLSPARVSESVSEEVKSLTRKLLERLGYVGTLCVECFVTQEGQVLVNELAPRPHNSGHLTIESAETSQFEQHVRAVLGMPLGSTKQKPSAMVNLMGDHYLKQSPNWAALDAFPEVKLHRYGKAEARPGRKMAHLTACADSAEAALERVKSARARLFSLGK